MTIPNTNPINIPILTFLINIPKANPIRIAKMKAISPRRTLGCLLSLIKLICFYPGCWLLAPGGWLNDENLFDIHHSVSS
jgi:hypothetical protein